MPPIPPKDSLYTWTSEWGLTKFFIQEYSLLLTKLKSGAVNSGDDYYKAAKAISNKYNDISMQSVDTACYRLLSEMRKKYELQFIKDVDRATLHNAEQTYYQKCEDEVQNANKKLSEERKRIIDEVTTLGDKLK